MAKLKGRGKPANRADEVAASTFSVRCSREFRDWLDALCKHRRTDTSTTIEHALVALARAEKFEPKPPERWPARADR